MLMQKEEDTNEPFDYVCLAVSDLDYSYEFYTKLMGMTPDPYFDFSSVPNMKDREYKVSQKASAQNDCCLHDGFYICFFSRIEFLCNPFGFLNIKYINEEVPYRCITL